MTELHTYLKDGRLLNVSTGLVEENHVTIGMFERLIYVGR